MADGFMKFERCPVSRPGWQASGVTNCTHESGLDVWLPWGLDRWRVRGVRSHAFTTRDDAMLAAELIALCCGFPIVEYDEISYDDITIRFVNVGVV